MGHTSLCFRLSSLRLSLCRSLLSCSCSLLCGLSSSLFSSLSSELSLLSGNSLSLSVLNCNLCLSSSNSSLLGSLSQTRNLSGNLSQLSSLPSLELSLCLLLGEGTLLDATMEVLHQENANIREDLLSGEGWLCASLYPIESTLEVNIDSSRVGVWIVSTDLLNILTITWRSAICDYD